MREVGLREKIGRPTKLLRFELVIHQEAERETGDPGGWTNIPQGMGKAGHPINHPL